MLIEAAQSALVNVVILAGLPFLFYALFHRWRHERGLVEATERAGLRLGELRYIGYSAAFALVLVVLALLWTPPLEPLLREGSAMARFRGLGLDASSVVAALLYGMVKTGFAEELLFRGLIAGSLGRRLSLLPANLLQASIFLLPHLLLLFVMPEMWPLLVLVFVAALVKGWLRIRSGSIVGPWLIHGSLNVTMCLIVAVRTAA